MKALPFKIPKTEQNSFHTQLDEEPYFYDTLHQHPEIQVTLIEKSYGTLIHGDYLGSFIPGDVFVIGANAPHVFRNDKLFYNQSISNSAKALTFFFDENTLGKAFLELPEARDLAAFISKLDRGIKFTGLELMPIRDNIRALFQADGMDRIIALLKVLKKLMYAEKYEFLSQHIPAKRVSDIEGKRLNDIFNFTIKEYARPIQLEEVAALSNLTKTAFCRYFKQHTRKTYLDFLNEYRIGQACKMLSDRSKPIAQIAFDCGFNNLSNFNRRFKSLKGVSPRIYTQQKAML
ncbi:AraC family transcriptional regulator [Roseivirga sp.]|uniref:AraC family transcriptional regulator n=1 Tax=Roseivirga sp. TaxID=1964215 RepID=UPI003B8AF64A